MGKESDFVNGLRITDAETRDVALMVLAGMVNKSLVAAIVAAGRPAIGLCGGDGMAFRARKKQTPGYDLGFVGEICSVEPRWLEAIWGQGGIPVLSSLALGFGWRVLQRECGPDGCRHARWPATPTRLIFLTDVPGVKDARGHSDAVAEYEADSRAWLRAR